MKWQQQVRSGDQAPLLWNGKIWLLSESSGSIVTFDAFDPITGQHGQTISFPNLPAAGEVFQITNGQAFFICSEGGTFCGVGLNTNKVLWKVNVGFAESDPWYANGIVYFHTDRGFYAVNAANGTQVFDYNVTGGGLSSDDPVPTVVNNTVYFTSNGIYYAVNATTGKLVWSSKGQPYYYAQGTYFGGTIVSPGNPMVALNPSTGAIDWTYNLTGNVSLVGLASW